MFEAETIKETQTQDPSLPVAIDVVDASFTWEEPLLDVVASTKRKSTFGGLKHKKRQNKGSLTATTPTSGAQTPKVADRIFSMTDITMSIPRGQLCAIVGPVGSGKTSLLQGLIGEMRRTGGRVAFNGSIAYCPQSAWIQNATVRENICFGRPLDEARYWKAVRDACLDADLQLLPAGDMTEVGEKGISLSGGQKQRLNICRAIYVGADIQIFDDPFSALDAHVGRSVFQNVLLSPPEGTTRVLVTHALHFLPQVDYIYTVVDGRLIERGSYAELLENGGEFAKFVREFGAKEKQEEEEEEAVEEAGEDKKKDTKDVVLAGKGTMMQTEERNTGSVNGAIYRQYLHAGRGEILIPFLIISVALLQGIQVMSSYW